MVQLVPNVAYIRFLVPWLYHPTSSGIMSHALSPNQQNTQRAYPGYKIDDVIVEVLSIPRGERGKLVNWSMFWMWKLLVVRTSQNSGMRRVLYHSYFKLQRINWCLGCCGQLYPKSAFGVSWTVIFVNCIHIGGVQITPINLLFKIEWVVLWL